MRRRRRSRQGDRSAAEVYDRLAPAVLGYFRSHRMVDAEDLTGDVFVAVTRGLSGFEGDDDALRRWVFTIAHHRRVDEIRRRTTGPVTAERGTGDRPVEDPAPPDPELVAALGELTSEQREVVTLRFVADLPVAEVAALTGRSDGAVKMLQARGLESLRRRLRGAGDGVEKTSPDP